VHGMSHISRFFPGNMLYILGKILVRTLFTSNLNCFIGNPKINSGKITINSPKAQKMYEGSIKFGRVGLIGMA